MVLGLYVLAIVMVGSDVPRGTRVAGVDIGTMSTAEARTKLTAALPSALPGKLALVAAERTFELVPAQSGMAVDAAATAEAAKKNNKSFSVAVRALFGAHRSVEPVLSTDVGRLNAVLDEVGGMIRVEKIEGTLAFLDGVGQRSRPGAWTFPRCRRHRARGRGGLAGATDPGAGRDRRRPTRRLG